METPPPTDLLKRNAIRIGRAAIIIAAAWAIIALFSSAWAMPRSASVALVILAIAATLWILEAVPLFVTSFLILLLAIVWLEPAMGDAGISVPKGTFLSPFFSDIILLFLGGFVLSAALHKYRLDEQMARWIIRRTGTSLPRLMFGIMMTTAVLSMWLSNTATAAMMLALVLPIVKGLPAGASTRKAMVLAVPLAANAGGLGTPIGSPPNAIAIQYMRDLGIAPSFGTWMMIGVPFALVLVLLAWVLLVVLFKARGRIEDVGAERIELHFNAGIILVVGGSVFTILGWITSGWHGLSPGTIALFPLILFFGTGILNVRDLRGMSWDVLLVMGGGLCLGAAMSSSGLAGWVVEQLQAESLGLTGVMIAFGILALVMSTVMSNTATANLIMPIVLGLSIEPLSPVLLAVAFSCSLAMALPISTPPNAMAFSSEEIGVPDLLRPGLILSAIGIALTFTVGYWWWQVAGIF